MSDNEISLWFYPLVFGQRLTTNEWVEFRFHDFLNSPQLAYALREDRRADLATEMILRAESFKQNPAGTLPDDDVQLADLARVRDLDDWRRMRAGVLQDWEPCLVSHRPGDDRPGQMRLSHRDVAEIAAASWLRKAANTAKREEGKAAVQRSRVRKVLVGLNKVKLAETKAVVEVVTQFLIGGGLTINPDNVILALEEAAGVPRVVRGPGAGSG